MFNLNINSIVHDNLYVLGQFEGQTKSPDYKQVIDYCNGLARTLLSNSIQLNSSESGFNCIAETVNFTIKNLNQLNSQNFDDNSLEFLNEMLPLIVTASCGLENIYQYVASVITKEEKGNLENALELLKAQKESYQEQVLLILNRKTNEINKQSQILKDHFQNAEEKNIKLIDFDIKFLVDLVQAYQEISKHKRLICEQEFKELVDLDANLVKMQSDFICLYKLYLSISDNQRTFIQSTVKELLGEFNSLADDKRAELEYFLNKKTLFPQVFVNKLLRSSKEELDEFFLNTKKEDLLKILEEANRITTFMNYLISLKEQRDHLLMKLDQPVLSDIVFIEALQNENLNNLYGNLLDLIIGNYDNSIKNLVVELRETASIMNSQINQDGFVLNLCIDVNQLQIDQETSDFYEEVKGVKGEIEKKVYPLGQSYKRPYDLLKVADCNEGVLKGFELRSNSNIYQKASWENIKRNKQGAAIAGTRCITFMASDKVHIKKAEVSLNVAKIEKYLLRELTKEESLLIFCFIGDCHPSITKNADLLKDPVWANKLSFLTEQAKNKFLYIGTKFNIDIENAMCKALLTVSYSKYHEKRKQRYF